MIITIFNKNNGKIDRTIYCTDDHILLNYDSLTEDYIEGEHDGTKYYIDNREPFLIPDAPNDYSKFDHDTKQWVKRQTDEQRWDMVRFVRYKKLESSDWTDTLSAKSRLGDSLYEQWQTYRQALRDITTQADPFNITWPTPPQ
jgi:hypothetical protein